MADFDLNDFRLQLRRVQQMGSMKDLLKTLDKMLPGGLDADAELRRVGAILDSMTPQERLNPGIIDLPRRRRIARGFGGEPVEVNKLLQLFDSMNVMMRSLENKSPLQRIRDVNGTEENEYPLDWWDEPDSSDE